MHVAHAPALLSPRPCRSCYHARSARGTSCSHASGVAKTLRRSGPSEHVIMCRDRRREPAATTCSSWARDRPVRRPRYWLASRGHRVLVVEKKRFPREKTCGDGLTPRAVRQLHDIGLAERLAEFQRYRRSALDRARRSRSSSLAGASGLPPVRVCGPPPGARRDGRRPGGEGGRHRCGRARRRSRRSSRAASSRGAMVRRGDTGATEAVRARYVVVADGANSRFGRALGTSRDRGYPLGMAIRGYFTSPFHDEPWIESHLDLRDKEGNHLPGYGWVFPVGDGTVNVGVGLLSTFAGWKDVNTTHLMEAFCDTAPARWGLSPETATCAPTGGRLPTGGSVLPRVGPTFVVVRRCRGLRESVQRRGDLGRVRDRPARGRRRRSRPLHRRRPGAADLRRPPRRGVRPLFQGGADCSCARSATPPSCAS